MATSVTFEQENQTKLSFRTIQRVSIEKGTSLWNTPSTSQMVLWRDYLIGSYVRAQTRTHGLFLWSTRKNSIFYFEVCHSFFPSPGVLNPNSRQMEVTPLCTKVIDDLLFTIFDVSDGTDWNTTYRCIHIPSLVNSIQLPGEFLSLMENAFLEHLPNCIMKSRATWSPFSDRTTIYSVPNCHPAHPRYCFIVKRFPGQSRGMEWEVLEVEIDLSIPGPIKVFSRVSRQYTRQVPPYPLHDNDNDLLLYLPLGRGSQSGVSLCVRFLRVGKPGKVREARLGGVDKMHLSGLIVDRDAGYVIIWVVEDRPPYRGDHFIWWLEERKPGKMVYSRTKELISSWTRGLLWGV